MGRRTSEHCLVRSAAPIRYRLLLAIQLGATLLILAFAPGNALKAIGFAVVWSPAFRGLSFRELLIYLGVCVLFSVMDILAVRQGVFRFWHPDLAGLPIWEYFMWGFYVIHVLRMLDGPSPSGSLWLVLILGILFALPFSLLADPVSLLSASGVALALALFFFHGRWDLLYVGYTLIVGAAVEYTGVWSGQWGYPADPAGGVPLWFVTMWAGIGLFIRRLALPMLKVDPSKPDLQTDRFG